MHFKREKTQEENGAGNWAKRKWEGVKMRKWERNKQMSIGWLVDWLI